MAVDAASEIEDIIERVQNLANLKSADSDGYAIQAIIAVDPIQIVEGVGDVAFSPETHLAAPNAADLPSVDLSLANFDSLSAAYTASVTAAFLSIINNYFPDDAAAHQNAVNALTQMAAQTGPAIDAALAKLGGDTAARAYLNDRFTKVAQADSRLAASIASGSDATSYLQSRLTNGTQAAAFLISKFMAGNSSVSKLLEFVAGTTTAIPTFVEDQTWQRDRNRILQDATRQKATTSDQWAAKGFPLPPGALIGAFIDIDNDAGDKISESSRDRVIKNYDVILENMRLGVQALLSDSSDASGKLMTDAGASGSALLDDARAATTLTIQDANDAARVLIEDASATLQLLLNNAQQAAKELSALRIQGIEAAIDYMKAIALGPQLGLEAAKTQVEAKARVAEVTAQYYSARISAAASYNQASVALDNVKLNAVVASADNRTKLHLGYVQGQLSKAQIKAGAATAAMQSAGTQAAAALSTLSGVTSLSSSS